MKLSYKAPKSRINDNNIKIFTHLLLSSKLTLSDNKNILTSKWPPGGSRQNKFFLNYRFFPAWFSWLIECHRPWYYGRKHHSQSEVIRLIASCWCKQMTDSLLDLSGMLATETKGDGLWCTSLRTNIPLQNAWAHQLDDGSPKDPKDISRN